MSNVIARALRAIVHVLLATVAMPLGAADSAALIAYLDGLDSFTARFTQQRFDEDGALLETAHGDCHIERPGRFRWAYGDPYPQLIVSDGATLWIYDRDLEQVTRASVDTAGGGSPAALLGRETDVATHYAISPLAARDGLDWYRLEPKAAAGDFTAIELGFGDGEVRAMRLTDNLGQVTALTFSDVVRDRDIDDTLFDFSPPPGVDVVEGGMTR